MKYTSETLKAKIQEMPLKSRIASCINAICEMSGRGRCPKMSIPVQPTDEDVFMVQTLNDCLDFIKESEATDGL